MTRSTRREFLKRSLTVAAAGGAAAATSSSLLGAGIERSPGSPASGLPKDFAWGVATAAIQIEGAAAEDGRKPSIWDTFCATPGKIVDGSNVAVACDHYHRFREDVALMAELGVKHYRFSLSWPRILPDGRGAINEKGVDFYKRLVDCLGEHGITPHATLYHWDCPQSLEDEYGSWRSRRIVDDFGEYASVAASRLGDRVRSWMTLNEIETFAVFCGYGVGRPGTHAPGIALARRRDQVQITHHALLAHGRACQALRAASPGSCRVGIAAVPVSFVPVIETAEHIEAAQRVFRTNDENSAIIVPLLTGRYDPEFLERLAAEAPEIREGDLETIGQPLDFLGVNCYSGAYVRAAQNAVGHEGVEFPSDYPIRQLPWLRVLPEAMYWVLRNCAELAGGSRPPMYITENGCPGEDRVTPSGEILDVDRIYYLRAYLRQMERAVQDGYPVKGYFSWSLMDNFEWAEGYSKRFGLVHVDFATQQRTPKLSFRWMQETIRNGRVM